MFRRYLARLVGRGGGDGEASNEEAEDTDGDDSGFLPSRLDASVLYAHGMGRGGADREIANVQEKGEILEEARREE